MVLDVIRENKRESKMIFIKKRIQAILDLKKERHFLPGVLLGGYAIVILASVMSIWSFIVLGHLDNPFFNGLLPVASLFFPFYVAMIIIFAGKEIIWCHMMMFKQMDKLFKWAIDSTDKDFDYRTAKLLGVAKLEPHKESKKKSRRRMRSRSKRSKEK